MNEFMYYADPSDKVQKVRLVRIDSDYLLTHYVVEPVEETSYPLPHSVSCRDLYERKEDAEEAAEKRRNRQKPTEEPDRFHVRTGIDLDHAKERIYAGTMTRNKVHWTAASDVTNEAVSAVGQYLLDEEQKVTFQLNGKYYQIIVREVEEPVRKEKVLCKDCKYYDCTITSLGYCNLLQCFEETDYSCDQAEMADEEQ